MVRAEDEEDMVSTVAVAGWGTSKSEMLLVATSLFMQALNLANTTL
jgi:hypothetical protein